MPLPNCLLCGQIVAPPRWWRWWPLLHDTPDGECPVLTAKRAELDEALTARARTADLSEQEERPVRAVADAEHDGNLSAAIRALIAEALTARTPQPADTEK